LPRSTSISAFLTDVVRGHEILPRLLDLHRRRGFQAEECVHPGVVALGLCRGGFRSPELDCGPPILGAFFADFVRVVPREHLALAHDRAKIRVNRHDNPFGTDADPPRPVVGPRDSPAHAKDGRHLVDRRRLRLDLRRRVQPGIRRLDPSAPSRSISPGIPSRRLCLRRDTR
jgi:hypothetical protein